MGLRTALFILATARMVALGVGPLALPAPGRRAPGDAPGDAVTVAADGISVAAGRAPDPAVENATGAALQEAAGGFALESDGSPSLVGIQHEIRTRLNGMLGMAELLLLADNGLPTTQRLLVERLLEAGTGLLGITEDALDFTRYLAIDSGVRAVDFQVRVTVDDVAQMHAARAARHRADLHVSVAADVPAWLRGDVGRLRQVLGHLITRAVERAGGAVDVAVMRDGGSYRCTVTAGDGTTGFSVALEPVHGDAVTATQAPPATRRAVVLVVDDDELTRDVAVRQLEWAGYSVCTAATGAEAVEALQAGMVDAVFMDCEMPVMDGLEATRRIRRQVAGGALVPIIAFTGMALEQGLERCLRVGMDGYVTKPASGDDLVASLQRHGVPVDLPQPGAAGQPARSAAYSVRNVSPSSASG